MATFNKFEQLSEDLASAVHNFKAAGHTLKFLLSNTAPNAATNKVKADITEIGAGNGYAAGGEDVQNDISRAGMTTSVTGVTIVWTAAGGSFGPQRYQVLYNDSVAVPLKPLIGYVDYGSSITINDTETFTITIGASIFTIA